MINNGSIEPALVAEARRPSPNDGIPMWLASFLHAGGLARYMRRTRVARRTRFQGTPGRAQIEYSIITVAGRGTYTRGTYSDNGDTVANGSCVKAV